MSILRAVVNWLSGVSDKSLHRPIPAPTTTSPLPQWTKTKPDTNAPLQERIFFRDDMLHPVGRAIQTVEAKRLFKEFQLGCGIEHIDATFETLMFAAEIRNEIEHLQSEVADCQDDVQSRRQSLADELRDYAQECRDAGEPFRSSDVDHDWLEEAIDSLAAARAKLRSFKADKRPFLVAKLNEWAQARHHELHGD